MLNREFKKLQRQLQRKRHIKIELCVKLSLLQLFHVDHVVQNRRSALSLAWYEWFSCKGKERKIYCCELALSSEPQMWKFHVAVWQTTSKHRTKMRPRTCSTIIFLHSTNEIIDLWRWRCCRQILNSLISLPRTDTWYPILHMSSIPIQFSVWIFDGQLIRVSKVIQSFCCVFL